MRAFTNRPVEPQYTQKESVEVSSSYEMSRTSPISPSHRSTARTRKRGSSPETMYSTSVAYSSPLTHEPSKGCLRLLFVAASRLIPPTERMSRDEERVNWSPLNNERHCVLRHRLNPLVT